MPDGVTRQKAHCLPLADANNHHFHISKRVVLCSGLVWNRNRDTQYFTRLGNEEFSPVLKGPPICVRIFSRFAWERGVAHLARCSAPPILHQNSRLTTRLKSYETFYPKHLSISCITLYWGSNIEKWQFEQFCSTLQRGMEVPYVPRSSAQRMATSGPIFWSFGQKPQNFINQEEWLFRAQRSITQIPITKGLWIEITIQRRCIVFTTNEMDGKPYWASIYPQSNPNKMISGGMGPSPRQCYKATY